MTPEQRAGRAVAIRALLEDPNVADAFAAVEADLVAEWRRCRNAQERDNLWRAVDVLDRLKVWLQSAASHDLVALRRGR